MVRLPREDRRATHLLVIPGCRRSDPAGDVVQCDVAREAVSDVLDALRRTGVDERCAIAPAGPWRRRRPWARIGPSGPHRASPDDGIVWDVVVERALDDSRSSWSYYAFLCLATTIAAIAVLTDSSILVVGAMVVGPEFGPVAALAVAAVLRRRTLAVHSLRLLLLGFAAAIAFTALLAVLARLGGWIQPADLLTERPLTGFIWRPDRWSVVVALLAGAAGVLSVTAGRASALVGVFISVTTVPAAGNLALAVALSVPAELRGSAAQLGLNLTCMALAGTLVLAVQRIGTRHRR